MNISIFLKQPGKWPPKWLAGAGIIPPPIINLFGSWTICGTKGALLEVSNSVPNSTTLVTCIGSPSESLTVNREFLSTINAVNLK